MITRPSRRDHRIETSTDSPVKCVNTLDLRGWANYYRYCTFAGRVYSSLDWYISDRLWRWLRKKRPKASAGDILGAYQPSSRRRTRRLWREGSTEQHLLAWTPIHRYRLAWMRTPNFAMSSREPDA